MGPTTGGLDRLDPVDDEMEDATDVDDVEVTRAQIEQTRSEISETIDAIKERLQPQTLIQQAKETVQEATSSAAHHAVDSAKAVVSHAVDTAREAVDSAKEKMEAVVDTAREKVETVVDTAKEKMDVVVDTAKDKGSTAMEAIKANPIPYSLIGIGLSWLCMNAQRQRRAEGEFAPRRYALHDTEYQYQPGHETREWTGASVGDNLGALRATEQRPLGSANGGKLHHAREKVEHMAEAVQERAGQVAHRVQDQARHAAEGIGHTFYRNPLAMGIMALGLGAALGFLIPETYQENRLMGETRDRFVDRAQETAQEITHKVQAVAQETMDTAAQKAKEEGLAS